jgi:uncharacterized protein YggE
MRQKVREQAIHAAQEKAEVYSAAAGVRLGAVVHIEDLNPDRLRGNESHHVVTEPQVDEEGPLRAIDPGSIVIGGAVLVSFRIET